MIYQTDDGIDLDAKAYSCRFNCLARAREVLQNGEWTVDEYNRAWRGARTRGIISGDLNADGDFDDAGEDEILNDQALFDYLALPLRAVPLRDLRLATMTDANGIFRIAPQETPLDYRKYWVLERWVLHGGHFVHGDGTGRNRPYWDPIPGGSNSRRKGRLESLRVFEIVRPE